jgi:hypothetical protein
MVKKPLARAYCMPYKFDGDSRLVPVSHVNSGLCGLSYWPKVDDILEDPELFGKMERRRDKRHNKSFEGTWFRPCIKRYSRPEVLFEFIAAFPTPEEAIAMAVIGGYILTENNLLHVNMSLALTEKAWRTLKCLNTEARLAEWVRNGDLEL